MVLLHICNLAMVYAGVVFGERVPLTSLLKRYI